MDFLEFKKKITEHFDHCDVADVEGNFYVDQKTMSKPHFGQQTLFGNKSKLYDTIYLVSFSFYVKNIELNIYENIVSYGLVITRCELKRVHDLIRKFGMEVGIYGGYNMNSSSPKHRFTYDGRVVFYIAKDSISDFTWKDDVLLKALNRTAGGKRKNENKDIWSELRRGVEAERIWKQDYYNQKKL